MTQIIRNRRVEDDRWITLGLDPDESLRRLPAGALIVPLPAWTSRRGELLARHQPLGVWLEPSEEPVQIAPDLEHLSIVAVHFPKWGDGRGFSTGTLLRKRFGWRGELRAFGEIGRDHLFMLARCGFDSFRLAERHDPAEALAAFDDFSLRYQGCVDDPVPLFRKRLLQPVGSRHAQD
jgi:uncharacterized protein (DUF934 family)